MSMVDLPAVVVDTHRVPPRMPPVLVELLRELIGQAKTHDEIREEFRLRGYGISDERIYLEKRVMRAQGFEIPAGQPGRPRGETDRTKLNREKAKALRAEGLSIRQTARAMGMTPQYIQTLLTDEP